MEAILNQQGRLLFKHLRIDGPNQFLGTRYVFNRYVRVRFVVELGERINGCLLLAFGQQRCCGRLKSHLLSVSCYIESRSQAAVVLATYDAIILEKDSE